MVVACLLCGGSGIAQSGIDPSAEIVVTGRVPNVATLAHETADFVCPGAGPLWPLEHAALPEDRRP